MKKNKQFTGILFDMDGVIVDSMPYHFIAWYEALAAYGVTVNCLDIYAHEGESWQKTLPYFLKRAGHKYDQQLIKDIFQLRQKLFKKYFKRRIFPGIEELLLELTAKGYSLALVSGTPSYDIKKILPRKIFELFKVIVGGEMVSHGKPDPEPYIYAINKLKLKAKDSLVVENAPLGISSAKAAGSYCIALDTSLPAEYLSQADQILHNITELKDFVLE
jgi:beta-phosphoglucomutase